ncbi:MAG: penicillin-binding protein activator LpoB [Lentisphaeraceae bacterium]|nr:penicillin-binding protein activator LpoB [Lentisphaeraceae bacterium]
MTDKMVRDMLQNPILNNSRNVAVVIVDDKYFTNESTQRINKKLIVDRLRTNLFRAANGRIRFIARHASKMFEHEQKLRQNKVIAGGKAKKQAGATYRMTGNFKNLNSGVDNYVQVLFEMVDLNTGELVWTNMYEFKKNN